jgi:hypothetical protein
MDGDLTSWSIGGPPPNSLLGSIGLLGAPQGLSGSHNKYEGDASPTRPDLYVAYVSNARSWSKSYILTVRSGNNFKSVPANFQALYNRQANAESPNYDLRVIGEHRSSSFNESINTNPYFFNAVSAQWLVIVADGTDVSPAILRPRSDPGGVLLHLPPHGKPHRP